MFFSAARQRDRVKWPILVPFTIVLVCIIGALLATAYLFEVRERERNLSESVRAVERMFHLQVENEAAKLHATLFVIGRDEAIKTAFLKGDQEALLARVQPLFQRLSERHRVTHFYLNDAQRINVLRVHQPDLSGDVIDRATTLKAEATGREAHGVELGPLGTLTLRTVKPWYDGQRLIGYLELGEQIDHVTQEIHRTLGTDLLVLVHRDALDEAMGREGHDSGPEGNAVVVASRTMDPIPAAIADSLERENHHADTAPRLMVGGDSLYTAVLPLNDAAGRRLGDMVIVRDVSALQAAVSGWLGTVTVLALLIGSLVFALFYVILDRIERDSRRQREVETQFARLSTEHQRMVQIEKLSEVGRAIGEIAHQINNPLVGVINMAQLAERELEHPERVRPLLGDIRRAGQDCHAFVKRMLAFTRVSRSERKPTEISALVRDTLALFQQSAHGHPQVSVELPDTEVILDVDAVLIRHALFNLLANAARANPPDGVITISLAPEAGADDRAPGWCLSVRDQGPGIPEAVRDKIFAPFFTTHADGTGLGLAVVQHVAILHDGHITVGDKAGGANFALWIPAGVRP